jgi:hypothetical protein
MFKTLDDVAPALAAVSVLTNPDGIAGSCSEGFGQLLPWRRDRTSVATPAGVRGAGAERGFVPADLAYLDRCLGVPMGLRVDPLPESTGSLFGARCPEGAS